MKGAKRFASLCCWLGFATLCACSSSSSSALTCSDPKTTEAVVKYAKEDLTKKVGQDVALKTEMILTGIKTTNDKDGRHECAAELDAKFPTETHLPEAKLPITYVSEHNTETGHSVKVHGL